MPTFAQRTFERVRNAGPAKEQTVETLTLPGTEGSAISIARTPGEKLVISMILPEESSDKMVAAVLDQVRALLE